MTLLFMLFAHVIADYTLQGNFVFLKTKKFWVEQGKNENSFIPALIAHSFLVSFCISLPLYMADVTESKMVASIIINTIIHSIVDHLSANSNKFGLITDQLIHVIQIVLTYIVLTVIL